MCVIDLARVCVHFSATWILRNVFAVVYDLYLFVVVFVGVYFELCVCVCVCVLGVYNRSCICLWF